MPTEGGVMVDEPVLSGSPTSTPSSPKSRIKFLCSHGGKILPQPTDGHLKYVGGETRVISVSRDIKLSELMKKLTPQIEGDMVLKYQLVHEDLDSLISVKNDEDLRHMLDEYDRCESAGAPRLRAFLFPEKPVMADHHAIPSEPLEQRYIDAINGIIRAREAGMKIPTLSSISQASFGISSACTSPRSPESCTNEGSVTQESLLQSIFQNRSQLHKVQSSPSFYNATSPQQHGFHYNQQPMQQQQQHYYNYRQPNYNGYQLSKPPPCDPLKGPDRLFSVRSVGRAEGLRYQVDHNQQQYYQTPSRHSRGSGCCARCMQYDDCGERRNGSISPGGFSMELGNGCPSPGGYSVERRTSSLSPSPIPLSPRFSHMAASGET